MNENTETAYHSAHDDEGYRKKHKSRQSCAPGFTTPSDEECHSDEISVCIDETINGHGSKFARSINDDEVASKVSTNKAKSSNMQKKKVNDDKAAAVRGTSKAKLPKKLLQSRHW